MVQTESHQRVGLVMAIKMVKVTMPIAVREANDVLYWRLADVGLKVPELAV